VRQEYEPILQQEQHQAEADIQRKREADENEDQAHGPSVADQA
jgi:hypothetical protein